MSFDTLRDLTPVSSVASNQFVWRSIRRCR